MHVEVRKQSARTVGSVERTIEFEYLTISLIRDAAAAIAGVRCGSFDDGALLIVCSNSWERARTRQVALQPPQTGV